jgi:ribosome biogenesis GTPase A
MLDWALEAWGMERKEETASATLERIGSRLGCLVRGGEVNMDLAGRRFIESFSTGKLGRFTLEEPGELQPWEEEP